MKQLPYSFITSSGRHTINSFGKDIGLHNLEKLRSSDPSNLFNGAHSTLKTVDNIFRGIRLANDVKNVITGLMPNGDNSVANTENTQVPYSSVTEVASLGRELSVYHKTRIDIGRKTIKHIRNIQQGPFIETISRTLSSSMDDYQNHNRRQQLVFRSGFNERGFSFLSENNQMTVSKYYKLFDLDKEKTLKNQINGEKLLYGCILNTTNRIKLKNRSDIYTTNVRIHLVKILDLETDVRTLLLEITNNEFSENKNQRSGKLPKELQYTDPEILNTNNKFSINFTTALECNLNLSTRFQERAKILKSWNSNLPPGSIWDFECVHHLGKGINLNKIYDLHTNVLSIGLSENSLVSPKMTRKRFSGFNDLVMLKKLVEVKDIDKYLKKKLLDSIKKFENGGFERQKKLSPTIAPTFTSTAENANLKNNNSIEDENEDDISFVEKLEEQSRNNHPVSYIFVIEYVGDRRATIVKNDNYDRFTGYSPVQLNCEFEHKIKYLADDSNEDKPMLYKESKLEKNFNENNEDLKDYFYPERQSKFHVPFDQISFNSGPMRTKGETDTRFKKYFMEADINLGKSADNSMLDGIEKILKSVGLNDKNKTGDDLNLNYTNPSSSENEIGEL